MALRVWLPFNGSVENKGISNTTMSGSPSSWGNGKIGKCATFTGNVGNVIYNNTTDYNYTDKFSWAVWINTNFTGTTSQFAFTNGRADAGGYGYGLQCSNSTTCNIRFGSQSFGVAVTGGEWTHLTFTKNGTSIKIYKNGSIVTDTTFTGTLPTYSDGNGLGLGCFHYSGNIYPFYGSLNDFRIYDHCLSPKEVKEISQGLVLHYKLDGWSGGNGENLAYGTNTADISTNIWRLSNQTGGTTNSIEYDGNTPVAVITRDDVAQSGWSYLHYDNIHPADIKPSTTYTISFDVMTSVDGTIGISALMQGNATNSKSKSVTNIRNICTAGTWSHIILQTITKDDFTDINNSQVIYLNTSSSLRAVNVTIKMKNMKMEIGSKDTPWSPALTEIGIDTTKIIDSSGYGNDGTVTGTLSTESDSDRYEISTHYSGSSYTDTVSGTFNWFDFSQCTLSAWIKPTASVSSWSGSIGVQHDQNASHKGFTITDYANNFRVVTVNGSYTTIDSGKPLTVGEWHHCAAVLNGTNLKMYYDGAMVKESTVSWGSAAIATDMRFATGVDFPGSNEMFNGNYSDVRMYCTALSAEDILDIYHTSANVDDLGNLHGFEFVEDDDNRVDKQGLVHAGLLSSDSDLIKLLYDKKLHIEPDGSVWAHIYHHNRPDLGSFSSTDDFANSVKIDDNRWFNATEIVNSFSSEWEFLIIYNFTQGGTVYKERWIQTKNPETAVFGDVDAADITRVTGNGYRTGTWGGLYKKNSSAYWVMNNGTNGNWWGATGSFSIYQGGIPGYGGSITTTGCNDLYIRIDRFSSTPTHASIGRGSVYTFNDFIEK